MKVMWKTVNGPRTGELLKEVEPLKRAIRTPDGGIAEYMVKRYLVRSYTGVTVVTEDCLTFLA